MSTTGGSGLALSVKKVLSAAFQEALEQFDHEFALLLYRDYTSGCMEIHCSYGFEETPTEDSCDVSFGVIRSCLLKGETVKIVDVRGDSEMSSRKSVIIAGIRSVLCVPIRRPDKTVVGAFYFDNRLQTNNFAEEGVETVEELAAATGEQVAAIRDKYAAKTVVSQPSDIEIENWTGIRRAGLQAFGAGVSDMAVSFLERAVSLADSWGPCKELALSLNELGQSLRAQERIQEAAQYLERGLSVLEQVGLDRSPQAVPLLNNLAGVHHTQGKHSQAEALYRYCLDIMADQPHEMSSLPPVLSNLGMVSLELGDPTGAQTWLEKAVAASERIWGPDHAHTVKCRQRLGALVD